MKYFTRSRILLNFLICLNLIWGILIALQIPEIPDALRLNGPTNDRLLLLFLASCILFIFTLVTIIVLKCIIKDAEEDLNAVLKFSEDKIKSYEK